MTTAPMQARSSCLLTAVTLLVFGTGCSPTETTVEVNAFLAESGPLSNLEITAIPFDPGRLLDSLAAVSPAPRPTFPELEAEMAAYRRPEVEQLRAVGTAWRVTRDSVARLADSLRIAGQDSPGYDEGYERLRRQYQRLTQRAVERDAEFRAKVGEDRDLALRASAAADSLRVWEQTAYADFPELADSIVAWSGHQPQTVVTDEHGNAELGLAPGAWWLVATVADRYNPFVERHWNVGIIVTALGPSRMPLSDFNSAARWRH